MRKLLICSVLTLAVTFVSAHEKRESTGVPSTVRFAGTALDQAGALRSGTVGVVFALYARQTGGAPLWVETQNVQLDAQGRYTVNLGAVNSLPHDIFVANEARWLGVQVLADAAPEQGRVMLVSVPYALKAQDAETLGGRPASAYLLAESLAALPGSGGKGAKATTSAAALEVDGNVVTVDPHTVNAIPKFSATDTLDDSLLFELYGQQAFDAFGADLGFQEDVVRVGDGSGLSKAVRINGRMVAQGFDVTGSLVNSVRVVNSNPSGTVIQANATSDAGSFSTGIFATVFSRNGIGLQAWAFEPTTPPVQGVDYSYGMLPMNTSPLGAAVYAWQGYDGVGGFDLPVLEEPAGIFAMTAHTSGIPAIFDQRGAGGGQILSARTAGTEVTSLNSDGDLTTSGDITATGTITAASFSGDGSALTNVTGVGSLASDPAACSTNNFVTDIAADGTLTCAQPSSSNLSDVANLATAASVTALAAPQYVTLAASGDLTNERVLTAGTGIALTDGGAGAAVTINNKVEFAQTTIQSGDTLTSIPAGGADFATTYTIPANTLSVGMVIEVWASGTQSTPDGGQSFGYGVRFNSTNVTSSPNAGIFQNNNVLDGPWTLTARITCTSVSGSTATLEASAVMSSNTSATGWSVRNFIGTAISVDPTLAQVVSVRELVNSVGTNSSRMRQMIVKVLK